MRRLKKMIASSLIAAILASSVPNMAFTMTVMAAEDAGVETTDRIVITENEDHSVNAYLEDTLLTEKYIVLNITADGEYAVADVGNGEVWYFDKEGIGSRMNTEQPMLIRLMNADGSENLLAICQDARYTGIIEDTYYKNGVPGTGIYKEKYYKNGKLGTGVYENTYYENGTKATATVGGVYYYKGTPYSGLRKIKSNQYCYVNGKKYIGELTKTTSMDNKKIQYFTYKFGKKTYAFDQDGKLYKNQIIGSYFYDSAGVRNTDAQIKLAVTFVKKHGGSKNSRSAKLKKCFSYLANRNHYRHNGDHTAAVCTTAKLPGAANKMLKNGTSGTGNCFSWASSFAYIATVLGYDAKVCKGTIRMVSGGMGPHGWAYVKSGGSWKVCDANMNYKKNCYMKTYKNYPFKLGSTKTYFKLTASGGSAKWSK
jgi:hypothetical protein